MAQGPDDNPDDFGSEAREGEVPLRWGSEAADQVIKPRREPVPHKDRVRAALAIGLLATLVMTILLTFCLIARHDDLGLKVREITDSTGQLYTALITLVGTATGFYFGGREKD